MRCCHPPSSAPALRSLLTILTFHRFFMQSSTWAVNAAGRIESLSNVAAPSDNLWFVLEKEGAPLGTPLVSGDLIAIK